MFSRAAFRERIKDWFLEKQIIPKDPNEEFRLVQKAFPDCFFNKLEVEEARGDLQEYAANYADALKASNPKLSAKPNCFFWPDPRYDATRSLHNTMPYVEQYDFVDRSTKIGSAGSCFASEIAKEFQRRDFNYVVAEPSSYPEKGVYTQAYLVGTEEKAMFPAAWGLLFYTSSFKQLAEKAFELKELPRFLFQWDLDFNGGWYFDPFRESMMFRTPEAFEWNYEVHRRAARKALLESEVFVMTFGLNEQWEFASSGAASSMPPKTDDMTSLMRYRTPSIEENIANAQSFIDIVRHHNPKIKFIISVSPVGLGSTFRRDAHVIAANCHSKSVMRVVAEEVVSRNKDCFYMPSYELITMCSEKPWSDKDHRHVHPPNVEKVMRMFDLMFVKPEDRKKDFEHIMDPAQIAYDQARIAKPEQPRV